MSKVSIPELEEVLRDGRKMLKHFFSPFFEDKILVSMKKHFKKKESLKIPVNN